MYKIITALAIACFFPSSTFARPPLPPREVHCSFNGVRERCMVEQDSDGSLSIEWPGGSTNYYDCGRYQAGKGTVSSGGKTYFASCYVVKGGTIYKTANGITFIGQ